MAALEMDLIIVEILPRLPAKSLNRFKCVSKSFQTTISSREFAKIYLRHQSRSIDVNKVLVLGDNHTISCYDLDSTAISNFSWGISFISVVGTFNGFLCVRVIYLVDNVCIHNPFTKASQYVHIPYIGQDRNNFGFAFDHEHLDYKIVAVSDSNDNTCYNCEYDSSRVATRKTRVYSMNTSSWTIEQNGVPVDSMKGRHDGALINSHLLHWIFWNSSMEGRIGCFNVCTMMWVDDVLLPHYYYELVHKKQLLDLGVYDECLFSSFENGDDSCYDVWVMKEYGVQDSWFKLLSIPLSDNFKGGVVPVACRGGSDEILIRQRHSSRLFWFNRRNDGITSAKFDGAPNISKHQVYVCIKSLADPPRCKVYRNDKISW